MTIGILKIVLFIPASNSLKEKRMVLHSLKARLRNSFNLAVTQVGDEDKWQKATLALVGVERDRKVMDAVLSETLNFINNSSGVDLINYEMETI